MKIRGQTVYSSEARLRNKSKINNSTGCIEWTGCTFNGYGKLTVGSRVDGTRKTTAAHRFAYETHIGEIPDGLYVCHRCDNRKCINPAHLFVGTHQDNVNDRESKNRNNHVRKITDENVAYIHTQKHIQTSKELADELNISYHTVKDIWCGKTYPHLKPTPPEDTQ